MKKIISTIIVSSLMLSQIGCANKVLTTPLNRAKFDSNYTYNIHAIQNTQLPNISGSNIQNLEDRIHITQDTKTKYLLHNQIQSIDGESNSSIGRSTLEGLGIGAAVGGSFGIILLGFQLAVPANDPDSFCEGDGACNLMAGGVITIVGAGIGGLIGMGIGATIPKKQKVQIVPYISPTSQGVTGGANLGMKF